MQKLMFQKPVHTKAELRQGNFADSLVILFGTNCIEVTPSLPEAKKLRNCKNRIYLPLSSCLLPLTDTMAG